MSQSLRDSALRRTNIHKMGDLTELIFDGQGALLTFTIDWRSAERWATSRVASGNQITDMGKLMARIEPALVRRGTSVASTSGSNKALFKLVKAMAPAGLDPSEWQVPTAVKDMLEEEAEEQNAAPEEAEAEEHADQADQAGADTPAEADPNAWYAAPQQQQSIRKRGKAASRSEIDRLLGRD